MVLLTPEQALTLREWFLPDQPGPLAGLHILNSGNGACFVDRWPEPRTVLAGTGGNYTLLGDPRALRPADLQPHVRGYLNTTEALVPLLVSAFPDAKPWARVILARHASSKSIAIGEHDVRRLGPRDAHYVAQLGADSAWISMTWGGPSGLASSGYAWGAFAAGRLVSVACTFFLGQTLEDIGVVTEPDFRGQGLSAACASALCRDISLAAASRVGRRPLKTRQASALHRSSVSSNIEWTRCMQWACRFHDRTRQIEASELSSTLYVRSTLPSQ